MKIQILMSDLDGKEMVDHFHISIERPGFTIEYPKSCFTNRLELDLTENQIVPLMQKLSYHRMNILPTILPEGK